MFRGPSFIVSTMQEETTPIFKRLWYDWTQQQPAFEPTNPLESVLGPPYRRLLRSAGATGDLFVTRVPIYSAASLGYVIGPHANPPSHIILTPC